MWISMPELGWDGLARAEIHHVKSSETDNPGDASRQDGLESIRTCWENTTDQRRELCADIDHKH